MNEVLTSIRLPQELLDRIEALVPVVAADPVFAAFGRVGRSSVLRLSLVRGVESLEKRYKAKSRPRIEK
jgi:hypothetical protein